MRWHFEQQAETLIGFQLVHRSFIGISLWKTFKLCSRIEGRRTDIQIQMSPGCFMKFCSVTSTKVENDTPVEILITQLCDKEMCEK